MMARDIELLSDVADGFVVGCLKRDGDIDVDGCRELLKRNRCNLPFTFHRAFDMAKDPMAAMETIAELGFSRLLTSGQEKSAFEGRKLIEKLNRSRFGETVTVMPGGGINEENLGQLLAETGCREFHASARVTVGSEMSYRNERCAMGSDAKEYTIMVTSKEKVENMVKIYNDTISRQ
jgi:copper homeostasis protein